MGFLLFVVALALRLFVAIFSPGTGDVQNFIRTARLTQQWLVVYRYHEAYPYPPLYAWILAGTLNITDQIGLSPGFSVRLPAILADSTIAVLVFLIAWRLNSRVAPQIGWLYVFNPITVMIASHHGQFDPLAYLPAVLALWLYQVTPVPHLSALLLGLAGALKVTPLFVAPAWLPCLPRIRQRFIFTLLALSPFALALLIGWCMAPQAFVENVLGYRTFAEGGWGYNFITLLMERAARQLHLEIILRLLWAIRSLHQYILIGGILFTAWLAREKDFLKRAFLIQLSVQLFAGRWGHEYTAWIVPLAVLSNQRGVLAWGGLTVLWMVIAYTGFITMGGMQDNLFRTATVVGFFSWLALGLWFISNLVDTRRLRLPWFRAPLFRW
jgi:hypothetical protein